ncbi:MAG: hypothetical protein WAT39_23630 [Planctomycetota bacterium]
MMTRLILTGACALFLVGCSAKTDSPSNSGPAAAAVATDTTLRFTLGEEL